MATVTLSSKNQITIPVEMVRALGLKATDKLAIIHVGDHLALYPEPANVPEYIVGSMKGFWGGKEEIDQYISELRSSPERDSWIQQVEDLLAADRNARSLVATLRERPNHVAARSELIRTAVRESAGPMEGLYGGRSGGLDAALDELVALGAVRKVPGKGSTGASTEDRYLLVREFAKPRTGVTSR